MGLIGLMRPMGLMGLMRPIGLMRLMGPIGPMGLISLMGLLLLLSTAVRAKEPAPEPEEPESDSIAIGGHVYGGGNVGNVAGSTRVTIYEGNLNNVFGGARLANVGGRTFVHVDGEHSSDDIFINTVYGGNDISGTIGKSGKQPPFLPN